MAFALLVVFLTRGSPDFGAARVRLCVSIHAQVLIAKNSPRVFSQNCEESQRFRLLPRMDNWDVFAREATAAGMKAIEQGVAGFVLSEQQLFATVEAIITHAHAETHALMEAGLITTEKA